MKRTLLVVAALGVGVIAVGKSCTVKIGKDPDEKLASRFDDLCDIARHNVKTPVAGVNEMGDYFAGHLGDVTGDWGSTIALIEQVPDDRAHDERARLARDRMREPVVACQETFERFGRAVDNDPEAARIVDRAMKRLERTLNILSGKRVVLRSMADVPSAMLDVIESSP